MFIDDAPFDVDSVPVDQLRAQLEKALGYYAFGLSTFVNADIHDDEETGLVQRHESLHRDLAAFTAFGNMQMLAFNIIEVSTDPTVKRDFTTLLELLIRESWFVYEGLATFNSYLLADAQDWGAYRDRLPKPYKKSLDEFRRLYVGLNPSFIMDDGLYSFVTYNVACAAMCSKSYLPRLAALDKQAIESYRDFLVTDGPNSNLRKIVGFLCKSDAWNEITASLASAIDRFLPVGRVALRGRKLSLLELVNVAPDRLVDIELLLNGELRRSFARVLSRIGIDTYSDYDDWVDDRESLVERWLRLYRDRGTPIECKVQFKAMRPHNAVDDTWLGFQINNRFDFAFPSPDSIFPEDYARVSQFDLLFTQEIASGNYVIVLDIASLATWKHPVSDAQLMDEHLMFCIAYSVIGGPTMTRYLVLEGNTAAISQVYRKHRDRVIPMLRLDADTVIPEIAQEKGARKVYWYLDLLTVETFKALEHMLAETQSRVYVAFYRTPLHPAVFVVVTALDTADRNHSMIWYTTDASLTPMLQKIGIMKKQHPERLLLVDEDFSEKDELDLANKLPVMHLGGKFSRLAYDKEMVIGLAMGMDVQVLKRELRPVLMKPSVGPRV